MTVQPTGHISVLCKEQPRHVPQGRPGNTIGSGKVRKCYLQLGAGGRDLAGAGITSERAQGFMHSVG